MKTNYIIKKGTYENLDFIVSSQIEMAFETEQLNLDPMTVHKGVLAVLNDPSKGEYYLAHDQNTMGPVGMLLTIPEWSDWRNGTVLWIHSVFVVPSFRKCGVYKTLYLFLKNMVEESSSLRGLRLYVDKSNKVAQKTYFSLGMDNNHYELYEWLK